MLNSTGTIFAGVPVGSDDGDSTKGFKPQLALTNFSGSTQTIDVVLASSQGESDNVKQLEQLTLSPNSSRLVDYDGIVGAPHWRNSFTIQSSGNPGDVMAKMMFKSIGPLPNVELIGKDERDTHNTGDHPWTLKGGSLYLFNHESSSRNVTVRLGSGTAVWLKQYIIRPNETKALSISDLIQSGTKDDQGRIMSRSKDEGEIAWWVVGPGLPGVSGRVVQTDASGSVARNFSCGSWTGLCQVLPWTNSYYMTMNVGDQASLSATPIYCVYSQYPTNPCNYNGQTTNTSQSLFWEWSSADNSIVSVNGNPAAVSTWTGNSCGQTRWAVTATTYGNQFSCGSGGGEMTTPKVTSSGPQNVALANGAGTANGTDTIVLTAVGTPAGGTYSWTSNNSNVTLSNANSAQVSVTAAQAGSADLSVTYTVNSASASATETVNVVVPTSVTIANDTGTQNNNSCSAGPTFEYYGPQRDVLYTILDGNQQSIGAKVNMSETFTRLSTSGTSCGATPVPTTNQIDVTQFDDHFANCSNACLPAVNNQPTGSCTSAFRHVWTANGFAIFDHTVTYTCTTISPQ